MYLFIVVLSSNRMELDIPKIFNLFFSIMYYPTLIQSLSIDTSETNFNHLDSTLIQLPYFFRTDSTDSAHVSQS